MYICGAADWFFWDGWRYCAGFLYLFLGEEILFENKNATVKKISKETENGVKEYVYLDLLDENGNIKTSIPLKEPKKEEHKNNNK